jgi:hypothetical protein
MILSGIYIFLTSLFSGIHGNNKLPKGIILVIHLLCTILISIHYSSYIPVILFFIYWFFVRSGKSAHLELQYMSCQTNSIKKLCYFYIGIALVLSMINIIFYQDILNICLICISCIIHIISVCIFRYNTSIGIFLLNRDFKYRDSNNGKGIFFDCRRPVELTNGIFGGCIIIAFI